MYSVNLDSIIEKVEESAKRGSVKKKVDKIVDDIIMGRKVQTVAKNNAVNGRVIADQFISTLTEEIESLETTGSTANGNLGPSAVQLLKDIQSGSIKKIGDKKYQIDINFTANRHRDSLMPDIFSGIDNIVALLNNGYVDGGMSMTSHPVYGEWHGNTIPSLRQRQGAQFIQNAGRTFMANYGREYHVLDIIPSDEYI